MCVECVRVSSCQLLIISMLDCDECVSGFADAGGCNCMGSPGCDVSVLIPEGCFRCGDKAMAYCNSQPGKDKIRYTSSTRCLYRILLKIY